MSKNNKKRKRRQRRQEELAKEKASVSLESKPLLAPSLNDKLSPDNEVSRLLPSLRTIKESPKVLNSPVGSSSPKSEHLATPILEKHELKCSPNPPSSAKESGTKTFASRKRNLTQITFVKAKVNGIAEPYVSGRYKDELVDSHRESADIRKNSNGKKSETSPFLKKEKIDDILYPKKKLKLDKKENGNEILSNSSRQHHAEKEVLVPDQGSVDKEDMKKKNRKAVDEMMARQTKDGVAANDPKETQKKKKLNRESHAASPPDEKGHGRLSGVSVEDAVRDRVGLRPRANSTDGELHLPQRGLCDERKVLETYRWNSTMCSKPIGFNNLGNTCFLNSTLQCLASIPPFTQSLLAIHEVQKDSKQQKNFPRKTSHGKRITQILLSLFQRVHLSNGGKEGSAISPAAIVKAVPSLGSCGSRTGYRFRPGRQEDAHEFLVHLLAAMNDGELREAGINQQKSGWRDRLPAPRLDETTFIHRVFGGYLRSQVRCTSCNYCSNTYDPFLDLSLEISRKTCTSVISAFKEFTRKETLDSENRWKCSGCKKRVCATKRLTVFRPPLSLCIQLKRFTYNGRGFLGGGLHGGSGARMIGGSKISKAIEFPARLQLPLSDGRSCAYSLCGIVVHVGGSASSGHYTACVKRPAKSGASQWFHLDDSFVEPISEKAVLRQKDAYVLFYCREEVKLEFPAPPLRASMSTEEAKELSRTKARAKSSVASEARTSTKSVLVEGDQIADSKSNTSPPSSATREQNNIIGVDKIKQSKVHAENDLNKDSERILASPDPEGLTPEDAEFKLAVESETRDSGMEFNKSEQNIIALHNVFPSKRGKPSDKAESKPLAVEFEKTQTSGDSSTTGTDESSSSASSKDDKKTSEKGSQVKTTFGTPLSSSSSEDDSSSASSSSMGSNQDGEDRKNEPAHSHPGLIGIKAEALFKKPRTSVTLDRGEGGKVEVKLKPRQKKKIDGWKPRVSGVAGEENFDLLGNLPVGRWDDDGPGESKTSKALKSSLQKKADRTKLLNEIEKREKSRKRKMHLDRWDSHLDLGKTKKVKNRSLQVKDKASTPSTNAFQRIQAGIQLMSKGRPKGHSRTTSPLRKNQKFKI